MSLRWKIAVLVLAVFATYAIVVFSIQRLFVVPSYVALEHAETARSVERCLGALDREVHHLGIMCADWSEWDDTYEYVHDLNEEYPESNLGLSMFTDAELNMIYFINTSEELVWGKIYDLATEEEIQVREFSPERFTSDHPLMLHRSDSSSWAGIIATEQGAMVLAAHQILTSDSEGPPRGTMFMGRFVDSSMVATIRELTRENLTIWSVGAPEAPSVPEVGPGETYAVTNETDAVITAMTTVRDVSGAPVLIAQVDVPRRIIIEGRRAQKVSVFALITAGLVMLAAIVVAVEKLIVVRTSRLSNALNTIAESGDLSTRIELEGDDEFARLANHANTTFASLAKAEEAVRHREEQWKRLLEYVPVAIAVLDREARYVIASRKWIEDSNLQDVDITGRYYRDIGKNASHRWEEILQKCLAGSVESSEAELFVYGDGTERWVHWAAYPWQDAESGIGGMIVFADDISERIRAQELLNNQSRALMEASTPVMKLWDGAILVPLVGAIDDARANQMTELLLERISAESARVAVLDVTGIAEIDTNLARHLLRAVDSAKILGADVIITGFSPEAAQTLAQLGVDFSSLRTRGSLGAGVKDALKLVGTRFD